MNDDKLIEMIEDIDNSFATMVEKYQLPPMSFTAIILARILLINENCGSGDDFRKLLSEVATTPRPKAQEAMH